MILVSKSRIATFSASGAWGRVTLDGLLRKNAKSRPDALALADAPDREEWTGGAPRQLTFAELDAEIDAVAGLFGALGVDVGTVTGLQAPNTTDTLITFFAALRAGLIVTPLPLTWRETDLIAGLDILGAKAVIGADRLESQRLAEYCRNAATKLFGMRYVLGLSGDLPDGIVSLAGLRAETGDLPPPEAAVTADDVATVTWATPLGGDPVPLPRSHNQWIAAGLMHMLEARFEPGMPILNPYAPTGLVGLGAAIAPWLLSGAEMHLHHFRGLDAMAEHAASAGIRHIIAPASLVDPLATRLDSRDGDAVRMTAVWSNGHPKNNGPLVAKRGDLDLSNIGDYAYVVAPRAEATPSALPLGMLSTPSAGKAAPVLVESRIVDGHFALAGPMVPDVSWPGNRVSPIPLTDDAYVLTGVPAEEYDEGANLAHPRAYSGSRFFAGGATIVPHALDLVYSECPEVDEGAAFFIDDPVLGARIGAALAAAEGETPTAEALRIFLEEMRVAIDKHPAKVILVDQVPREVDGTVDREELAELAKGF